MLDVLLVGNPNSGKTTLFNSLTCSNEHIGNWHGVTVDTKKKEFETDGEKFCLIDTPGIYSLCPLSFEEEVAVEKILENKDRKIINIIDSNNIGRNLYLTLCLLEKGCDVVLAINKIDKRAIYKTDCRKLEQILGIDVVEIDAEKGDGLDNLKKLLKKRHKSVQLPYLKTISGEIEQFEKENLQELCKIRYDFIDQTLSLCSVRTERVYGKSKIDKVTLNKWLAFPVFVLVLAGVFYLTFFSLGAWLSDILSSLLSLFTSPILNFIENCVGQGWIFDLFNVAIFGGVGTVLSFLPQIALLFFFLSILEDSGYLSRIAFIFEDILGKIGLSGKSVYTLLMGFGCSTSAIMTSRNMDDKNAKIKTALLCPYMSCSAKIPIYTVIGGAFFGAKNLFVIIGLYFLGVVIAIGISKILDSTILTSKKQSFILEFPPYRICSPKRVGKILWKNIKDFLVKVGSVMVSMNIIIWLLSSFSFKLSYVALDGGVSMLETFGRLFSPIFRPLGFGSWAIVCSLLAGLVAKEVVVSSIAMFNGIDTSATKLISQSIMLSTSVVFFPNTASVLSFLVFCLLYTPCVASIAMLLQEIGKKWTILSVIIQFASAYILAFLTYQISFAIEIFGFWKPFFVILCLCIIALALIFVIKKVKKKSLCLNCDGDCKNCKK